MEDNALLKTTRVNYLFDFYQALLTEKQQTFLRYYFHDDYSLGEIAAEFGISRQAVYEHIKRAEQVLEEYERKLGLLRQHDQRTEMMKQLNEYIERSCPEHAAPLRAFIERIYESESSKEV